MSVDLVPELPKIAASEAQFSQLRGRSDQDSEIFTMVKVHMCQDNDCPCLNCSGCQRKYMRKHSLAHHQRGSECYFVLTSEQRAADQGGGEKLRQAAQEEELEVAVGEPREEEHQGLKEEVEVEMVVGEQSEQEEQVPLEVVEELVGEQSEQEEQVPLEVVEELVGRMWDLEEQWARRK